MLMEKNKAEIRRERILELLDGLGSVSVSEFCAKLGCSESTMRNDLTYLESLGKLYRTFGGAVRVEKAPYISIHNRKILYAQEKKEIAEYIVNHMIRSNDTIILDTGSTCAEIARAIVEGKIPVTIISSSLDIVNITSASELVNVYCIGGFYNAQQGAFTGESYRSALKDIHADIYFAGVTGIDKEGGITIPLGEEVNMKNLYAEVASKICAVADFSKFGKASPRKVLNHVDNVTIITDSSISREYVEEMQEAGYHILVADGKKAEM
ncbi:MAG: DeoR/GlpR family DNA-binding transcription regulator [Lachnospiraceae bacterium]|mgnify:CR=1 FL=1|nr:DeoR/GlpR family DNA-binding transcription regulator [Lachnospiraceae bacterium]